MRLKKWLRFIGISIAVIVGILIAILVIGVAPVDRTVDYKTLLDTMTNRIVALERNPVKLAQGFSIGFAKVNLTPSFPVAPAGKRGGKPFESVHDSVYVRTIVIDNGEQRVAIVSADVLIMPPTVTALLEKELPDIGFTLDNTYLGATHTHSSFGSWGKGLTSILYGSFDDSIVHFMSDKIKLSISRAMQNMLPSILKVDSTAVSAVYNRVTDDGPVDPLVRAIVAHRNDSSKLLLMSYTAHATCLSSRDLQLSGDYPGKLMQIMEEKGYTFSMFLAGAVGSHGAKAPEGGWSCVNWMAEEIAEKLLMQKNHFREVKDTTLEMYRVPLALSEPQPKILHNWKLRPWVFRAAFGEHPAFISVLRIGDIVMLSTPCDFSGEFNPSLDSLAAEVNVFPIVTSFNGGYIGYLTPEKYFDAVHSETQIMNWYGPGNGEYVEECLKKLMLHVANE